METLELLLTILIGILIGNFVVNHEWKKPRHRGASTVPPTTPPPTDSPITAQHTTEAFVTKVPKSLFVISVSGLRPKDRDVLRVKSLVKAIAGLRDSENDCVGKSLLYLHVPALIILSQSLTSRCYLSCSSA